MQTDMMNDFAAEGDKLTAGSFNLENSSNKPQSIKFSTTVCATDNDCDRK